MLVSFHSIIDPQLIEYYDKPIDLRELEKAGEKKVSFSIKSFPQLAFMLFFPRSP
jgi:hypothetical protein